MPDIYTKDKMSEYLFYEGIHWNYELSLYILKKLILYTCEVVIFCIKIKQKQNVNINSNQLINHKYPFKIKYLAST